MKKINNTLLIALALVFGVIVIVGTLTHFFRKPQISAVNQPVEETIIPESEITAQPKTETLEASNQLRPEATEAQTLKAKINSLISKINSNNPRETLKAEDELVELGKPALKELVNILNNLEPSEDILRPEIAFILGRFEDTEAVTALIPLLESENSYTRRNAINSLKKIRSQDAVFSLTAVLSDKEDLVRESAVSALGEIRGYEATEDLINRLKDENETEAIKLATLKALGQIKDARAVNELLEQLKGESEPFYKDEVADSLANIGEMRAVPGLNEYLDRIKNNQPENPEDLSYWQNSIDIAEQAIQRLTSGS